MDDRRPALRILSRPQALRFLAEIDAPSPDRLLVLIPPGGEDAAARLCDPVKDWVAGHPEAHDVLAVGGAFFWSADTVYLLQPPLPFAALDAIVGWSAAPVAAHLSAAHRAGVILLRLGGYAVGLFEGDEIVRWKVGGRFVKNRHRKGGQSQRRFERTREKQIREHLESLCAVVTELLLPALPELDAVFLGGDRRALDAFFKRCPAATSARHLAAPRLLDVPEPRLEILKAVPRQMWTSRLYVFSCQQPG